MSIIRSWATGCGSYLPARIMTNDELSKMVDTSDEWIVERSGIRNRHIAADGEYTSDLARHAAERAMLHAGVSAADVDLIVLATSTPDLTFPATATKVQSQLGVRRGAAFDIQAVCSGFIYALATADNFIRAGQTRCALVIGAETFSRILDWNDRTTCVLFGDGAGAVVLQAGTGSGDSTDRGVLTTHLHADGRQHDMLYVDGGPSTTKTTGHLRMSGREVFRHAVVNMAEVVQEALSAVKLGPESINWLIPHQANRRIIEGTARKLGMSLDRVIMTVEQHGNTSAASVPLALAEGLRDGRVKQGDLLLLEAMGGGFTWGSALVRW